MAIILRIYRVRPSHSIRFEALDRLLRALALPVVFGYIRHYRHFFSKTVNSTGNGVEKNEFGVGRDGMHPFFGQISNAKFFYFFRHLSKHRL